MRTCAEAHFYLTACGLTDLDRDNDGIPCEVVCGSTTESMRARMSAEPYLNSETANRLSPENKGAGGAIDQQLQAAGGMSASSQGRAGMFRCGEKRTCKEMTSCAEATFHYSQCGLTRLDGTGNGVPCKSLCR